MTEPDRDGLRAAAEAATPGTWTAHYVSDLHDDAAAWIGAPGVSRDGLFVASVSNTTDGLSDAAFIAAANPQAVLALLDELEFHESVHEEDVDRAGEYLNQMMTERARAERAEDALDGYCGAELRASDGSRAERDVARAQLAKVTSLEVLFDALLKAQYGDASVGAEEREACAQLAEAVKPLLLAASRPSPDTTHVPAAVAEFAPPGYSAACSCGYEGSLIHDTEGEALAEARRHASSPDTTEAG